MKKSIKMLVMFLAVAFGVLLATGTKSQAAAWNANLVQTDAATDKITLQWSAYLGADYYEVYFSYDEQDWKAMDYTREANIQIRNLTPGDVYYATVVAYTASYWESEDMTAVAQSTPIRVATKPEVPAVTGLKQTGAKVNSITMSWNAVSGATSYDVYRRNSWDNYTKVASDVKTTSYTVTGLSASSQIDYFVIAKKTTQVPGVVGESGEFGYLAMKTIPGKVSRIAMTNYWDSLHEASYGWASVNNAAGYQFELRNYNGKKVLYSQDVTGSSLYVKPYPKGQFTRAQVRAYIVVGNTKLYGAWSDANYNASNKKLTWKRSANRKKITLKWKKITGASGYKISISTKSDSGFKTVKKLSKKKTSITITKCGKKKLKKNKTYYVRVEYLMKSGKKTISSGIAGSGTIS